MSVAPLLSWSCGFNPASSKIFNGTHSSSKILCTFVKSKVLFIKSIFFFANLASAMCSLFSMRWKSVSKRIWCDFFSLHWSVASRRSLCLLNKHPNIFCAGLMINLKEFFEALVLLLQYYFVFYESLAFLAFLIIIASVMYFTIYLYFNLMCLLYLVM